MSVAVKAPEGTGPWELHADGQVWRVSGGETVMVSLAAAWSAVRRHAFTVEDGTVLPDRAPDDRPWRWSELPGHARLR